MKLAAAYLLLLAASSSCGCTHALSQNQGPSSVQQIWGTVETATEQLKDWFGWQRHTPSQSDGNPSRRRDFKDVDDDSIHAHWALLIAGSSGWWNYRHQADVAHAYQVLRGGGLHPDRIVVMMYDDLVWDTNNPHPGKLFNRPGGPDVYHGIKIDYKGQDVNAANFLAVLAGNRTAVQGKGTGKVILSGPKDRVFVFFSDHGSPGVLGMPAGGFLYADQLISTIKAKHGYAGYKEMVLYIEACESGSMFEGMLPEGLGVYVTTAANAMESSWGTYCPGMDIPADIGFDTCLGDLYSVAWMEDTECEDARLETLQDQFEVVKLRTSNNYTYNMGSHAMQYGAIIQTSEHTGSYLGTRDASACMQPAVAPQVMGLLTGRRGGPHKRHSLPKTHAGLTATVEQRDADIVPLKAKVARARTPAEKQAAKAKLDAVVSARQAVDTGLQSAAALLLQQHMQDVPRHSRALLSTMLGSGAPYTYLSEQLTSRPLPGREGDGTPLVDDWDCLRSLVDTYSQLCGPMDQYAMKHTRLFANLCNAGLGTPSWLAAALRQSKACPALLTAHTEDAGSMAAY